MLFLICVLLLLWDRLRGRGFGSEFDFLFFGLRIGGEGCVKGRGIWTDEICLVFWEV